MLVMEGIRRQRGAPTAGGHIRELVGMAAEQARNLSLDGLR